MRNNISTCIWTILFVITACVLGYMVVHGRALDGVHTLTLPLPHTREGMSSALSGDVYKNSAKIELLTEKVNDLKDVKKDLEDIRSKLSGNSEQIASLSEHMLAAKKGEVSETAALLE
jgi:hypothetical protein